MQATATRVLALVLLLLLVPGVGHAAWKSKVLATSPDHSAGDSDIAVGPDGRPHVVYQDRSNPSDVTLRHAHFDGRFWHKQTIDSGDVGWWNAIAIDASGGLHVSYRAEGSPAGLRYAHFDGVAWTVTPVDAVGGYSSAIAVDSLGHPHISHVDGQSGLRYAAFDGVTWSTQAIPGADALWFQRTSIVLDASDSPQIAYTSTARNVMWARVAASTWDLAFIDAGVQPSLTLDGSGTPYVAYNVESFQELRYARFDGVDWNVATITGHLGTPPPGFTAVGEHPDIAVDPMGNIQVTFGLFVSGPPGGLEVLVYGGSDGSNWAFAPLDVKNAGFNAALALDRWGLPHIAHWQVTGRGARLKYAESGIYPPNIVTKTVKMARVGHHYKLGFKTQRGKGRKPFTWQLTDGQLPPGLSLDVDKGRIIGTPTAAGTYDFTVQVTDALGLSREASFSLIVQ